MTNTTLDSSRASAASSSNVEPLCHSEHIDAGSVSIRMDIFSGDSDVGRLTALRVASPLDPSGRRYPRKRLEE
jgi:hypothetical protein